MDTERCKSCKGRGKTIGMGHIEKPCKSCNGHGHIKIVVPKVVTMRPYRKSKKQFQEFNKSLRKKKTNREENDTQPIDSSTNTMHSDSVIDNVD